MILTGPRGLLEEPSGFKGKGTLVYFLPVKAVISEFGAGHKTTLFLFLHTYRVTKPGSGHCKTPCCTSILCLDYQSSCLAMCFPLLEWLPFEWLTRSHPVSEPQLHSSLQAKCMHINGMTETLLSYSLCENTFVKGRAAMIYSGKGLKQVQRRSTHTGML